MGEHLIFGVLVLLCAMLAFWIVYNSNIKKIKRLEQIERERDNFMRRWQLTMKCLYEQESPGAMHEPNLGSSSVGIYNCEDESQNGVPKGESYPSVQSQESGVETSTTRGLSNIDQGGGIDRSYSGNDGHVVFHSVGNTKAGDRTHVVGSDFIGRMDDGAL